MSDGVVVLAAGAGTRLGGVAKALLRSGEQSFLERIVTTAHGVGVVEVVVVVGPPYGEEVAAAARALGVQVVENTAPERGMASSVALGFTALATTRGLDAVWLWPVDHPAVRGVTLRQLADALATHDVAQPRYHGRGGHPPLVARRPWAQLATCDQREGGAREVLRAADVIAVSVDDPGVVRDVDTPADLAEAR